MLTLIQGAMPCPVCKFSCFEPLTQGESLHCARTARTLRTHRALLLDYVPPEEPTGTPLGNTLRIRRSKLDWRGP